MKKSRKPIAHRNVARRDPALASLQREKVLERDGYRCAVETWQPLIGWLVCGLEHRLETAHVFRRHKCGDAIYDPDVAVTACKWCRDIIDCRCHPNHFGTARFPSEALDRAQACVRRYEAEREKNGRAVVKLKERSK